MTVQPFEQFEQHGPLTRIREGMTVYDRAGEKVGTVKQVYMGNTDPLACERGLAPATPGPSGDRDDSLLEDLAEVFAPEDRLPGPLRQRLLRRGYVAIDSAGIFTGDRFAMPDQLGEVRAGEVMLSVAKDELIKG